MSTPHIGQRVVLNTLLSAGDFSGTIMAIGPSLGGRDLCTVKLDDQDQPVQSVLYYSAPPELVDTVFWQVCYPMQDTDVAPA